MAKVAALFSGQGSQYTGMGVSLIEAFPKVREVYQCAGDIFGMDIINLTTTADETQLARTAVSQPLIFTLSVAAYTMALERHGVPDAAIGHSLGEFAALYAAGAFSLEDGFRIIKARAAAMERAATESKPGAMYAILSLDEQTITEVCEATDGFVVPVNMNLPAQTVISGEEKAAADAAAALTSRGAKAVKLGVGSAFHTKMMQNAADELRDSVANIAYNPTRIDFYSNLTGDKLIIENYPEYFAQHMVSPVRFVEQVNAMVRDGITACVEFGPKKTAATLAKKNARALAVANVEDVASLEGLAGFYEKL